MELILILVAIIAIIIKSKKSLHMLQQNLYNENNRYVKWVVNNSSNFFSLELLIVLIVAIANVFLINNDTVSLVLNVIAIILYIVYAIKFRTNLKNEQVKKPLVITARVKRLIATTIILHLIPIVLIIIYRDNLLISHFLIFIFILFAYLNTFVILLANFINKYTLEKYVYHHFKSMAVKKLKSMPNLKVIGVTGSYGKTSSKNILADILNIKYATLPTPRNLNTPYGLIITINNHLDKFTEVFIAEMGAYVRGEIKDLCNLVHPKYGILTRIGTAHLESFGSEENIQKTKFELIESLPLDGIGVLNRDDPKQVSYKLKNKCKILWIGIDEKDVDVHASDIKCSSVGTTFNVTFKGDKKKYEFETKLLGNHNVYNILAGIALGLEFGMNMEQLKAGVRKVRAVEHRLELKSKGDITFIDDAYNSNPTGSKMAIDVLRMMPGKHIIVTPGMIELGDQEYEKNKEFGMQMKGIDEVILVGEEKTKPIQDGLREIGFDEEHIHIINDVLKSFDLVNKLKDGETYVLLENDLPDIFNEK